MATPLTPLKIYSRFQYGNTFFPTGAYPSDQLQTKLSIAFVFPSTQSLFLFCHNLSKNNHMFVGYLLEVRVLMLFRFYLRCDSL